MEICRMHNIQGIQLIVMFKKPFLNYSSFVTWYIILLEVANRGWVHGGYKGDMVRNSAQVGRGI